MISYRIDRENASMRRSSVGCALTKRRVVDYCRLAAAL
jgi:hypothetical protein